MFRSRVLPALVLVVLAAAGRAQARDLREQYGTPSPEAGQHIQRGVQLAQSKKGKEAVAAFDAAIKIEKQCQMAHFQRAITQGDLGNIEEAIEGYKTCLSNDVRRSRNISSV